MPNRILKESICVSDEIDNLSWFEEVMFYRLIVKCDDFGRYDGRPKVIKGQCFPLKDVTVKDIEKGLERLSAEGLVQLYTVNEMPFLQLTTWSKHQTIRNKKSKYPSIEEGIQQLNSIETNCNQLHAIVPVIQSNPIQSESNPNPNTNPKGKAVNAAHFTPPTRSEVQEYISANGFGVDAQSFIDYYTSNGWSVGKTTMKDWKAAVRNWDRREKKRKAGDMPEYWNTDPIRVKDPKPASKEEIDQVKALISKGKSHGNE